MRKLLFSLAALALAIPVVAQDAVKVDPKHYTVVTENDQVRVLRAKYGPHEKSVMHSHPATVAVFLTDGSVKFSYPDGKSEDVALKARDAQYRPAITHLPENTGDKAFEVVVVELKGKSAGATSSGRKNAGKPAKKM